MLREQPEVVDSYPIIWQLDVTGRCNLACLYCQRTYFLENGESFNKNDLPEAAFDALRPALQKAKIVVLTSQLGEPLLNKAVPGWWQQIASWGINPQITTNGTVLKEEHAELFTQTGGRVKISIDSFNQKVVDVLRPTVGRKKSVGVDQLRGAVDMLERHRKKPGASSRFQLGMNLVVTTLNLDTLMETVDECLKRTHVNYVAFLAFRLPGEAQGKAFEAARHLVIDLESEETRAQFRKLLAWARERKRTDGIAFNFHYSKQEWRTLLGADADDEVRDLIETHEDMADGSYRCCVPWLKGYVDPAGNVLSCLLLDFARDQGVILGNVLQESFESIWNGPRYQEFRRAMKQGDGLHPACSSCKSWWRFYSPWRVDW